MLQPHGRFVAAPHSPPAKGGLCAKPHTFLRHGPQLQQPMQPAPQEPLQQGHTQQPLAAAADMSSPWRLSRQPLLQGEGRVQEGGAAKAL